MNHRDDVAYLSESTLDTLGLSADDVVGCIERVLLEAARGRAWNAPKSTLYLADGRYMMATLAAAEEPAFAAVKSLVLNRRNGARGLPQINALVTLLDAETGLPAALIDGNWVTAMRTAGLSAAAAARLARPDSEIVAFVGCGVQARSHLRVFAERYPLRAIRAFGRGRANRERLCAEAGARGLSAAAAASAREAIDGADLVVTSISGAGEQDPFVDARWLAPGAFAVSVDLGLPWIAESMDAFDRIVVDDVEQEAKMPEPMLDPARVDGDLAALVAGTLGGRRDDRERTAFVSRGTGLGDLAVAALVWLRIAGAGNRR